MYWSLCLILCLGIFFQVTLGPHSRSRSTDGQLYPGHGSAKTKAPHDSDSSISPAANFETPPELSSCLDNSAAKHKLLIKPRNQRSSKMRRFSQVIVQISRVTNDTKTGSSFWTLCFRFRCDKKRHTVAWVFHWLLIAAISWDYISGVDSSSSLNTIRSLLSSRDTAACVTIEEISHEVQFSVLSAMQKLGLSASFLT